STQPRGTAATHDFAQPEAAIRRPRPHLHRLKLTAMGQTETLAIEMPAMGESVTEGTVLEWHVSVGDTVSEGDTIVEVSTDKVDAEVPAPASGTITKLLAEPDEVIQIGSVLAEMEP